MQGDAAGIWRLTLTQLNSTQPKCLLCAMLFLFIRLELGAEGLHHVFISKERRFERRFENRVRGLKFRAGGAIITKERKRKRRRKEKERREKREREKERESILLDTMGIVVAACRRCCVVARRAPRCRRQRDELLAHELILYARRRPLYHSRDDKSSSFDRPPIRRPQDIAIFYAHFRLPPWHPKATNLTQMPQFK